MGIHRATRSLPAAAFTSTLALAIAASLAPPAQAGVSDPRAGAVVLRNELRALRPAQPKAPHTPAAILPVTSCADDNGSGTLRAVVAAAGDGDTVDLGALQCSRITLSQGAIPVLLDNLAIAGPAARNLTIDGAGLDRVLIHPGAGTLRISDVSVRDGASRVTGFHITGGGCIASAGYVLLDHAGVSDCYASGEGVYGGGIFSYVLQMYTSTLSRSVARGSNPDTGTAAFGGGAYTAYMRLADSTISGNRADHDLSDGQSSYDIGGGIFSNFGGRIRSSTIDNNYSTGIGGGVSVFGGTIEVTNSTISGNIARNSSGGGLDLRLLVVGRINNATIAANQAARGGGFYLRGLPLDLALQSTLVSGNSASGGGADVGALVATGIAGANNLVAAASANVTLPADTLHANPLLQPLANNGGPTRTMALTTGSPALDAGNNTANLDTDQRGAGFARVLGAAADIGAFEGAVAPIPPPVAVPAASAGALAFLAGLLAIVAGLRIFTPLSPRSGHSSRT